MSKKPNPSRRRVGRPAHDDTLMFVHFEAMRRMEGRSLNGLLTSTRPWSLRPKVEANSVVGEPTKTATIHRRFYAWRKRLATADAVERAQIEHLIEGQVDFLRNSKTGPITAQ